MNRSFSAILLAGMSVLTAAAAHAQTGVAITDQSGTTPTPAASAVLDVQSESRGVLVPRLNEQQRAAISNPATGLLVFQTDGTSGFYFYSGSAWTRLGEAGAGAAPTGSAGGDLTGTYPNPEIASGAVTNAEVATDAAIDGSKVNASTFGSQSLLISGDVGATPTSDAGTRLMWVPEKAAFRAGEVFGTSWDDANIGHHSVAMGFDTRASGNYSTALGYKTIASAAYSTAMGTSVYTRGKVGAFIIGDASTFNVLESSVPQEFTARFAGGYRLFTNADANVGVSLAAGGNSWQTISDSTRKFRFRPLDGEAVLGKLSAFRLSTWSYKGQDPAHFRHYGPMAQDFFAAFGRDGVGVIGNDTTIASADMDGVLFTAAGALARRTDAQAEQLNRLARENAALRARVADLESMQTRLVRLEALLSPDHEIHHTSFTTPMREN